MPTGWRPEDVAEKFPVYKIEDVYNFEKYATQNSAALLTWSWVQLAGLLITISYLFANIAVNWNSWYFSLRIFYFFNRICL